MDRMEQLQTYSIEELVTELERRRDEMNAAFSRIGAAPAVKNQARSEAARARWAKLKAEGHNSLKDAARTKKRR